MFDVKFVNVLQSAIAFLCVFAAFNSQGFIEVTILLSYYIKHELFLIVTRCYCRKLWLTVMHSQQMHPIARLLWIRKLAIIGWLTLHSCFVNTYQYKQHVAIISICYCSQAIIYAVFTLCNFIAAPIVNIITAKWAMVLGAICYCIFLASFLILQEWLLYCTSAIIGFGAAGGYCNVYMYWCCCYV